MIGFKDDGQDQYKWVIEFQCGTRPYLPKFVCLDRTVDDHCFFTGIQLFVRDLDFIEEGRIEMFEYIRSLGPEVSNSLPIAWVMDDFGGGTFPPWFKNVTESLVRKPKDHESAEYWLQKAYNLRHACEKFSLQLKQAAIKFPYGNSIVSSCLFGMTSPNQVNENFQLYNSKIDKLFWAYLKEKNLIRKEVITHEN